MEDNLSLAVAWGMRLISAALILCVGWMIGNLVEKKVRDVKKLDETLSSFLGGFAKYAIFSVALVAVLGQFGVQTASLITVLAAAGLAIGLALQGTLGNIAAGTMLLILRPFKVGDYITFGKVSGTVKSLGLFGTELATPDNIYIFAPNGTIWKSDIYNYSRHGERRQDFTVCISYGDDIDKAMKIIRKVLDKEDRLLTVEGKKPQILVNNMGDFSVDLAVRVWSKSADFGALKSDMKKTLKEALDKGGITIPFPTRTIEMINVDRKPVKKAA